MTLAPTDYDFGDAANYSFAMEITCANDDARAMFIEAYGHMLNYNHEQAIACFSKVTELDDTCAMAWWGIAYCVSSNYNWAPGLGSGHDSIQQAVSLLLLKQWRLCTKSTAATWMSRPFTLRLS